MTNEMEFILKNQKEFSNEEFKKHFHEYWDKVHKEHRLVLLNGYLIAAKRHDEVFEIILKDNPINELMFKLGLSKFQANALINMSIKRFKKLNAQKIENEIEELNSWLNGYKNKWTFILNEHEL